MRRLALVLVLALAAAGCRGDDEGPGGGDDAAAALTEIAQKAEPLTYKATYRFQLRGPLAEGSETKLEIVQRPPESLRLFQTTTADADGKTFTESTWIVSKLADAQEPTSPLTFYSCWAGDRTTRGQVRCHEAPPTGMFGRRQIDEVFEFVRRPRESFESVESLGSQSIAGEEAACFEAVHQAEPPDPAVSPAPFDPRRHKLQLCYSTDGILLRMHRSIDEPVPTGLGYVEQVLEATSVSRTVEDGEIELPGEVRTSSDLKATPSP
ncbi:MAG TPA: hypothetical protein VM840_07755 [Actinomycetota bacterium]|nr:hypothetical protein [Actinomycetota bacterium]